MSARSGPRRAAALKVLQDTTPDFRPRAGVPAKREVCRGGSRPCPWIRCRWHLALLLAADRQGRRGGLWGGGAGTTVLAEWIPPQADHLDDYANGGAWQPIPAPSTCALDIAEKHEEAGTEPTVEELGEAIHTKPTRTWMIVKDATAKLKAGRAEPLEEFDEP